MIPEAVQARRVADVRPVLVMMFAAAVLLLLIACSNVAGLLLARLAGRHRETSVRAALGASRSRIATQLIAEATLLAGVSAAFGLLLTRVAVTWLDRIDPVALPRSGPIVLDSTVVGFMLAAVVLTVIVCATAPAWHGSRLDLMTALRTGRGAGTTRSASRTRRTLAVAQIALALTLLVGAGLLVRSLVALGSVAPGYRTSGVLAARVSLPSSRYGEDPARLQFLDRPFARRYFPGEDPIGKRIDYRGNSDEHHWSEIVGVVGDVRDRGLDTPAEPQLYAPYAQDTEDTLFLVVRVDDDPLRALPALREAVRAADPELPIYDVSTMERLVRGDTSDRHVAVQTLTGFAGAAVLLAALGLYGLLAQMVRERRTEIGLRMALGASGRGVVRLFLREGAQLVGAGLVLGIILAYAARGTIASLVYGVSPGDSATYVAVAVLLAAIGLGACAIPAWRAAHLDPMQALRNN